MMNDLVSIIIPVFNSKNYIGDAIESAINQSYQDIEIIIVVDGSTDGSYEICKEYANQNERISIVYQENAGVSRARNIGLERANGKYVVFLDHDDVMKPELVEKSIYKAQKQDADITKFSFEMIDFIQNHSKYRVKQYFTDEYTKNDTLISKESVKNDAYVFVWDALYKVDFIKKNNISFDENYKSGGEDIVFNWECTKYSPRICFMNDVLYTHFNRQNQSLSLIFTPEYYEMKCELIDCFFTSFHGKLDEKEFNSSYTLLCLKAIGKISAKSVSNHIFSREYMKRIKKYIHHENFNVFEKMGVKKRVEYSLFVLGLYEALDIYFYALGRK